MTAKGMTGIESPMDGAWNRDCAAQAPRVRAGARATPSLGRAVALSTVFVVAGCGGGGEEGMPAGGLELRSAEPGAKASMSSRDDAMAAERMADTDETKASGGAGEEGPRLGLTWARNLRPNGEPIGSLQRFRQATPADPSVNLFYHGGLILTAPVVKAIFWGSRWNDPEFVQDKLDGLDAFYEGLAGSDYAKTNAEYSDVDGNFVTDACVYEGHVVDTRGQPNEQRILREVCRRIPNPVPQGYYPVYTDIKRTTQGYCAWHSFGTCRGVPVQYAFFFDFDGDSGCDPADQDTGHSQGLAALANLSGHEFSEAVTNPRNGGWWDATGAENSDKCAWIFPPSPVRLGGELWKVQTNWSNAAYLEGRGVENGLAQAGCIPND